MASAVEPKAKSASGLKFLRIGCGRCSASLCSARWKSLSEPDHLVSEPAALNAGGRNEGIACRLGRMLGVFHRRVPAVERQSSLWLVFRHFDTPPTPGIVGPYGQ